MFSTRIGAVSLCLACMGLNTVAQAATDLENHRLALTIVALEQVCNKAVPGLNGSVANLLANEPVDDAVKAEVHKVQTPQYKPQVDEMVGRFSGSPLGNAMVEQGTCKGYAAR